MPEHEARARAVYDHETKSHAAGRRRRPVADWGVGEELSTACRARRFDRRPHRELPREDIPRGDAADGRRTIVIETGNDELPLESLESAEQEFASRDEAFRARDVDDELWAGDEPFAEREPEPLAEEPVDEAHLDEAYAAGARGAAPRRSCAAPRSGRRTVKIGGRPAEFYGPPARRTPASAAHLHERLGAAARANRRVGVRARPAADPDRHRHRERLDATCGRPAADRVGLFLLRTGKETRIAFCCVYAVVGPCWGPRLT